jgi:hypothetical protein
MREEQRLGVFENRVLGQIFRPSRKAVTGGLEYYITRSFIIFTPNQTLLG